MAARTDYAPIVAALEAAGFHHSLRDYGEHGLQLVCVADRSPDGRLCGPSFWLCRSSGGRWFVAEWGGEPAYLLPVGADPAAVCVACLRGMDECMRVPAPVIAAFRLELLQPERLAGFDLIDPGAAREAGAMMLVDQSMRKRRDSKASD
jgi:hypothetical protein